MLTPQSAASTSSATSRRRRIKEFREFRAFNEFRERRRKIGASLRCPVKAPLISGELATKGCLRGQKGSCPTEPEGSEHNDGGVCNLEKVAKIILKYQKK